MNSYDSRILDTFKTTKKAGNQNTCISVLKSEYLPTTYVMGYPESTS